MRRNGTFTALGGFNATRYGCGREDTDLGLRAGGNLIHLLLVIILVLIVVRLLS